MSHEAAQGQLERSNINADLETGKEPEKFIIFTIDTKHYALYAQMVSEIAINSELFFIPFVPPYIRGFINRLGEPYTVFDLKILLENQKLEANKFLILNVEGDQIALIISDVDEIVIIEQEHIHPFSSMDAENAFFQGSIQIKENEVFILNINAIYDQLQNDI